MCVCGGGGGGGGVGLGLKKLRHFNRMKSAGRCDLDIMACIGMG